MSEQKPVQGKRRQILKLMDAAGLGKGTHAWASALSDRPIVLVCPYAAGGTTDQYLRALGRAAEKVLGRTVVIENKPGAGGALATDYITRVAPDGHTLLFLPGGAFRAPWLQASIRFDPTQDFSYIIGLTNLAFCLCVRQDSPLANFEDFIRIGKEKPGSLQYAAGSPVTLAPIAMASFQKKYGAEYQHIPYNSGVEITTALLGGHVDALMDSVGANVPYIDDGQFRLLAALSRERFKPWPEVPTALEQGYDLVLEGPMGLVGPKGMDEGLVSELHQAFHEAMQAPEIGKILDAIVQPAWYRDPAAYTAYAVEAYAEAGRMVKAAGLSVK